MSSPIGTLRGADFDRLCHQTKHDVVEWLKRSDLRGCSPQLADGLGESYERIRTRLRHVGVSWEALKAAERKRRLALVIAEGATRKRAAELLGFSTSAGLDVFLKTSTGKTYSEHVRNQGEPT